MIIDTINIKQWVPIKETRKEEQKEKIPYAMKKDANKEKEIQNRKEGQ